MGGDIVPGKPDESVVVQLIEGTRGSEQRMPNGSHPLSSSQIGLIRTWIQQGARNDQAFTTCYSLTTRAVFPKHGRLAITFRLPVSGVVELLLQTPSDGRVLFRQEGSIKPAPERMDAGAPNEWISWDIGRERTWPSNIELQLKIRYAAHSPTGAVLKLGNVDSPATVVDHLQVLNCMPP
jgi:hypothetical protein